MDFSSEQKLIYCTLLYFLTENEYQYNNWKVKIRGYASLNLQHGLYGPKQRVSTRETSELSTGHLNPILQ